MKMIIYSLLGNATYLFMTTLGSSHENDNT